MANDMNAHYAQLDLREWVARGGFLDDEEMKSAIGSEMYRRSPAFRAATDEKIALRDDRDTLTSVRVGPQEVRVESRSGLVSDTWKEERAAEQKELEAQMVERYGPQSVAPVAGAKSTASLRIQGFVVPPDDDE